MKKRVIGLVFCLAFAFLAAAPASAKPEETPPPITEPYEFPVMTREDWAKYCGIGEKASAVQVPPDILQRLTTDALVATVMRYPLFAQHFCIHHR